jgi:hypothetical protein
MRKRAKKDVPEVKRVLTRQEVIDFTNGRMSPLEKAAVVDRLEAFQAEVVDRGHIAQVNGFIVRADYHARKMADAVSPPDAKSMTGSTIAK